MATATAIIVKANPLEQARKGADIFCRTAKTCVKQKGCFAVAISGGNTPRAMHGLLAKEPYRSEIPWRGTHIFWVDERMVPFDHSHSNFGAAKRDLLDRVPLPTNHIHPMPVGIAPEKGARLYQEALLSFFKITPNQYPVFDLICLGLGQDGHVASLFPDQPPKENVHRWVLSVKGGEPDRDRLTLNYGVLNSANHIFFLVSGREKAAIVKTVFENKQAGLPAQNIQPLNGKLTWLLDRAAASLLLKTESV